MTDDNRAGSTQKHPKSIISFQKPHPSIAKPIVTGKQIGRAHV